MISPILVAVLLTLFV
jgi:hypothetical protein